MSRPRYGWSKNKLVTTRLGPIKTRSLINTQCIISRYNPFIIYRLYSPWQMWHKYNMCVSSCPYFSPCLSFARSMTLTRQWLTFIKKVFSQRVFVMKYPSWFCFAVQDQWQFPVDRTFPPSTTITSVQLKRARNHVQVSMEDNTHRCVTKQHTSNWPSCKQLMLSRVSGGQGTVDWSVWILGICRMIRFPMKITARRKRGSH